MTDKLKKFLITIYDGERGGVTEAVEYGRDAKHAKQRLCEKHMHLRPEQLSVVGEVGD